jgi:hypothetical protein
MLVISAHGGEGEIEAVFEKLGESGGDGVGPAKKPK